MIFDGADNRGFADGPVASHDAGFDDHENTRENLIVVFSENPVMRGRQRCLCLGMDCGICQTGRRSYSTR